MPPINTTMNPPTALTQPSDYAHIKNPFAQFIAQHTGQVSDETRALQEWEAELDFVRKMFCGQPWMNCKQCGRPLILTRQRKKEEKVQNPNWTEAVPIGALAPEQWITQPKKSYAQYAVMCSGKDADAPREEKGTHALVWQRLADLLNPGYEFCDPRIQHFIDWQKNSPAEPVQFFSQEDMSTYGDKWTYMDPATMAQFSST